MIAPEQPEGPPPSNVPTREALHDALVQLEDEAVAVVLGALDPVMAQVTASLLEHQPLGQLVITAAAVDDLTTILDAWGHGVDSTVLPYYEEIYRLGGMSATLQLAELGVIRDDFERITQPYLAEASARHLAMARDRFLRLGDDAWREARLVMLDGIDHGRGIPEIARNLRGVTEISRAQATMIARTEVVAAANAGALAQANLAGAEAPIFKQWLATNDERTRPSHWEADGQVTQRQDVFLVGGAMLEYPGDPKGPPEEIINCRCSILFTDNPAGEDVDGLAGRGEGGVLADVAEGEEALAAERVGVFPGGMTVRNAETWMRQQWGSLPRGRARAIVLQGLGRQTANEMAASMDRLLRKYPDVAPRIRGFGASAELTDLVNTVGPYRITRIKANSYADAFKEPGIIRMAPKTARHPDIEERLAANVQTGFHPPGTDSIDGVVTHEFGHHIYWQAQEARPVSLHNDITEAVEAAMLRYYERLPGVNDETVESIIADRGSVAYNLIRSYVIRTDISAYAATNYDELMASAFAMNELTPMPSQLARDLTDIMVRYSKQTPLAEAG